MHTLFINACVRPESRTKALADRLLERHRENGEQLCLFDASGATVAGDGDGHAVLAAVREGCSSLTWEGQAMTGTRSSAR
jgi:hypothetical protein